MTFGTVYGSYVTATSTGIEDDGWTSEFSVTRHITGQSTYAGVGDRVWRDLNGNGLQDDGEPGVAGVQVQLTQLDGPYTGQTTTDANGAYLFANLQPGDYVLQFTRPSGYVFTQPYQGDAVYDSDADPADGTTADFTLIAGQVERTFDAGLVALPPVANNAAAATVVNMPVTVNVLANDNDPVGDPLTVTAVAQPGHGTASINPDNTVTYTPAQGFTGTDSFAYTVQDPFGVTASAVVTVTVAKWDTTTVITSSANSSAYGEDVTFTAQVTPAGGSGPPTGTVTFYDGNTALGTTPLDMGMATFVTSGLGVGSHSVTAVYGGDATFAASTSAGLDHTVRKIVTSVELGASQDPVPAGQPVTFAAQVVAPAPIPAPPAGTVEFWEVDVQTGELLSLLGTVGVDPSGSATLTLSSLGTGTHRIKAVYSGDSNFETSFATIDVTITDDPMGP